MNNLTIKKHEYIYVGNENQKIQALRLIFSDKYLPNALIYDIKPELLNSGFVYLHEEGNYNNFFEDFLEPKQINNAPIKKRGVTNDEKILELTHNFLKHIN